MAVPWWNHERFLHANAWLIQDRDTNALAERGGELIDRVHGRSPDLIAFMSDTMRERIPNFFVAAVLSMFLAVMFDGLAVEPLSTHELVRLRVLFESHIDREEIAEINELDRVAPDLSAIITDTAHTLALKVDANAVSVFRTLALIVTRAVRTRSVS